MHDAGAWYISTAVVKSLAKDYDVTERQIYLDIAAVIRSIPKPKVELVGKKFLISFERAIDKSIELMRSPDNDIAEKGVKLYFHAVESYTKFLESYGLKEKVPEKYEVGPTKLELELIYGKQDNEDEVSRKADGSTSKK